MESWLYGSRTGVSPLAIIVAAIFLAWLWGRLGLVLSTPLTVCLAVLGRHVPQFEFFDVMFSNDPELEPSARVYQRLLAGALDLDGVDTVVLAYLNPSSPAWARQAVRRLKRRSRNQRVGQLVPSFHGGHETFNAESVNADFVVSRISDAVVRGFADEKPVRLKRAAVTLTRQRAKGKSRRTAAAGASTKA